MNDAIQQLFAAYPLAGTVWDALCVVIPLACLLAFSGIFFISAVAKIISVAQNRAAYDKCSRQTALLGIILGWILLAGSRIWLYYNPHQSGTLESFMLELSWMLFSLGVLLSSIYYTLWRILKNMPVLHVTLGMICAVQNCLALASIIFTIRISAALTSPEGANFAISDIFPVTWEAPFWSSICYTLPLIFGMGAAFCAVWLLWRRKHDDFGRDYNNSMLSWLCAWAANSWALLWLLLLASTSLRIWHLADAHAFDAQEAILESTRLLLWLLPVLLWTICRKTRLPLRHRWAPYVAFPIAVSFTLPWYLELTII